MALHTNNQLLIDSLQSLPLLDGRFSNIEWMNGNAASSERRGVLSLVFRADDRATGKQVALKFFDQHPHWTRDAYRTAAFAREPQILQSLIGADRCLQIVKPFSTYDLPVVLPGYAIPFTLPCPYFAVEWLSDDIDRYFLEQHANDAVDKLRLFNEIVLAVEALHNRHVFHRDLKADNLRASMSDLKRIVVAIDLGTAARIDSGYLRTSYDDGPVGALGYAAPEALGGLSGNRRVAASDDVYALGCLLFELFNRDYFYHATRAQNPGLDTRISAMASLVTEKKDEATQVDQWRIAISTFGRGISPTTIDAPGNSVPRAIVPLLDEALHRLTEFDYLNRNSLSWVRQRIWIAIRILQNEAESKRRIEAVRKKRELRLRRAEELKARTRVLGGPTC